MLLPLAFSLFAVAVYLFIYFIVKRDKGHREPTGALFIAMGFGFLAVILAGILNDLLVNKEVLEAIGGETTPNLSAFTFWQASFTVAIIEEGLKCIPLALFIYSKRYFDELTDGVIYFGITALTFGVIEHISYTLMFGAGTGITRVLFMPYLHVGFTILFGMALAYYKVLKKPFWWVVAGFLSAVGAHAIYDYFAFTGSAFSTIGVLAITITLNILVFVLFKKSQKGDEARGQSAVGINKYCRHCGRPNPKMYLYCAYCGKLS